LDQISFIKNGIGENYSRPNLILKYILENGDGIKFIKSKSRKRKIGKRKSERQKPKPKIKKQKQKVSVRKIYRDPISFYPITIFLKNIIITNL
jgi:hypothetical protein